MCLVVDTFKISLKNLLSIILIFHFCIPRNQERKLIKQKQKKKKNEIQNCEHIHAGFSPSIFVYSRFSPKVQFLYCLFSSVAQRGGFMVDTEGKMLGI